MWLLSPNNEFPHIGLWGELYLSEEKSGFLKVRGTASKLNLRLLKKEIQYAPRIAVKVVLFLRKYFLVTNSNLVKTFTSRTVGYQKQ